MKALKLLIPILILFSSCDKGSVVPTTTTDTTTSNKGYITVDCDNCRVDYGMPDQYKTFNVVTTSPKATFTYSSGYTLQIYITALDHQQKMSLNVFNTAGKNVYSNSTTQSLDGFWETVTLLP